MTAFPTSDWASRDLTEEKTKAASSRNKNRKLISPLSNTRNRRFARKKKNPDLLGDYPNTGMSLREDEEYYIEDYLYCYWLFKEMIDT